MCSNVKLRGMTISPGSHMISFSKKGTDFKIWGIGDQYNARSEKLDSYYKQMDKCYVEFTEFYEGGAIFGVKGQPLLHLAAIQDYRGILILTRSSKDTIIEPYHHRMPIVLDPRNSSDFVRFGKIIEMDYSYLKLAV